MGTEIQLGLIGVILGGPTLLLSLLILPKQIAEAQRELNGYTGSLLLINGVAIAASLASLWGAVERLTVGHASMLARISSSLGARIFFLVVVICLFLWYTVFNRRRK